MVDGEWSRTEQALCVILTLAVEGFGSGIAEDGSSGVESGQGSRVLIGLEKEAVFGADAQARGVEPETEAEVEVMQEELLHLLRFAAEAVPYPGLGSAPVEAEHVIDGAYAVEDEWTAEAVAEVDLGLKGGELKGVGCVAEAVKTAFADEETGKLTAGLLPCLSRQGESRMYLMEKMIFYHRL